MLLRLVSGNNTGAGLRLACARHSPGTEGYGVVRISTEQRQPGNAPASYPFVTVCYRLLPFVTVEPKQTKPRQTAKIYRGCNKTH